MEEETAIDKLILDSLKNHANDANVVFEGLRLIVETKDASLIPTLIKQDIVNIIIEALTRHSEVKQTRAY